MPAVSRVWQTVRSCPCVLGGYLELKLGFRITTGYLEVKLDTCRIPNKRVPGIKTRIPNSNWVPGIKTRIPNKRVPGIKTGYLPHQTGFPPMEVDSAMSHAAVEGFQGEMERVTDAWPATATMLSVTTHDHWAAVFV